MNLVERLYRSAAINCDDALAKELNLSIFELPDWGETCLQTHTRAFANSFCWFIPNDELIKYVAEKPTLEIMGGTGYFADLVKEAGGDIICTDVSIEAESFRVGGGFDEKPLVKDVLVKRSSCVEKLEASKAVKKYGKNRRLLIAWPHFALEGAVDYKALKLFHKINPTAEVIFIGECDDGCTGTQAFHNYLESQYQLVRNIEIPRWFGIHDRVFIYEPKK